MINKLLFNNNNILVEHFMLPPIPFIPMLFPIIMIAYILFKCKDILIPLMELVPKAIEVVLLLFNPKKFIDDLIFAITYGIKTVVGGMVSSMDSGSTPNPDEEKPDNVPKVCVPPSLFNLFILLICPPLALMIHNGGSFQGIFLVVVDAILTVWCYYFPGLIFAALHILC